MSGLNTYPIDPKGASGAPSTPVNASVLPDRREFAERLLAAGEAERALALREEPSPVDPEFAYLLKDICLHGWTGNSKRALQAAACLAALDAVTADPQINGCADWTSGVAALIGGRMDESLILLDRAAETFKGAGLDSTAAETRISKLIALAMLGRYDEAIECGLAAREILTETGDLLSLGKIEHNLGNIYLRREHYGQAEEFLRHALARFTILGDVKQQSMVQVNLAFIRTLKNDFRAADRLYAGALEHAVTAGLLVNQADIEANLGALALFQGKYDRALDYLERARAKFARLEMPHKTASSEQELADAYLELNLVTEAAAAYDRAAATFFELGLRAERAQVLAQRGRAAIEQRDFHAAHTWLTEAQQLFAAEGNHVGAARVQLTLAQLFYAEGEFATSAATAQAAEIHLTAAGIKRHAILAQWLRGDALRRRGEFDLAESVLRHARENAGLDGPPMIVATCDTSLGLLFGSRGDTIAGEGFFRTAIALIEELRAPLPAEEFRGAFLANNLAPYREMMRLCLADGDERVAEAFAYCEQAKSRALADLVNARQTGRPLGTDDEFGGELATLQEELNWYYSQLNRPFGRSADELVALQTSVRERETRLEEVARRRQLHAIPSGLGARAREFDLAGFQQQLGPDVAVVEYALLADEWLAFVVSQNRIEVVRNLATVEPIKAALDQFRFQLDSLRHGAAAMRRHLPRLTQKIQVPLRALYDRLLAPLVPLIGDRRLVVIPQGELHYVPFHALFNGENYAIEHREVSYAPSSSILFHCLSRDRVPPERAVLLGAADEHTPQVEAEVTELAQLFAGSEVLLGERASMAELTSFTAGADVLHLACHGQFRPDNPLFSSLRLANEWITARDVSELDLRQCGLVTLSACETGVSGVKPGDELVGLARGFFTAGASSLLLSQWVVDDASTAKFMAGFYRELVAGARPASALRSAQRSALLDEPHPFFWSPFVLLGQW